VSRVDPHLRAKLAAAARQEIARRTQLREQKAGAERSLLNFVRMFWRVLEPTTPLIEGWVLDTLCDVLTAITDGHLTRVIINVPPGAMKSSLLNVLWPAWEWGPRGMPHLRYLSASYSVSVPERDNARFARLINDAEYQLCWGGRVRVTRDSMGLVENDRTGWKRVVSTGSSTTGHRGSRILIDDANNPADVESKTVRDTTNLWLREVMPDRLNDLKRDAIINIQQRTHVEDATGTLVKYGQGYVWLVVPMEFDPLRIHEVVLRRADDGSPEDVWIDPRALDADGYLLKGLGEDANGKPVVELGSPMAQAEGLLCWPERFPPESVYRLKAEKADYAWCNPGEAPVLMGDLSLRRIDQVRRGDEVIGFESDCAPRREGERFARRRLMPSVVKSVSVSERPVVKITLDSGEVIRCTKDHKWFKGRGTSDKREQYSPARRGGRLMRICPPRLPVLETEADLRLAGWLAGFFDGEGSLCLNRRRSDYLNGLITFTQGDGRNRPLCEKLEMALAHFGFEFTYRVRASHSAKSPADHQMRYYWLKRAGLPVYQRFLHLIQPVKWRDRFIEAALKSGFVTGKERVLSIEPDRIETVYGLETTTGNYVVWGLASSNSGQYQQAPTVRGGGLIREDWWQAWPHKDYPEFGTIVASLDTAYEENEEADYNALTVWAAFAGKSGEPLLMLIEAWKVRADLATLIAKVAATCKQRRVDWLVIEHKTRGRDVHDEMIRQHRGTWQTVLVKIPNQDKASRLQAVAPMFSGDVHKDPKSGIDVYSGGMIYAPLKDWADDVIREVCNFPRDAHDDFCFVAGTLVMTRRGRVPIEHVRVGDEAFTPLGWRRVLASAYTGDEVITSNSGLTGTLGHPIFTIDESYQPLYSIGIKSRLGRLSLCGLMQTFLLSSPNSTASLIEGWVAPGSIISRKARQTLVARVRRAFMSQCGRQQTEPLFRQAMRSITETVILSTFALITWSAYRNACIVAYLKRMGAALRCWRIWTSSDRSQPSGIGQRKDENGTVCTRLNPLQKLDTSVRLFVDSAAKASLPASPTQNSVRGFALKGTGGRARRPGARWFSRLAWSAEKNSKAAGSQNIAAHCATSVRGTNNVAPVYNLNVEGAHCFYANGVLVHNCDSTSLALSFIRKNGVVLRRAEWEEQEYEAKLFRKTPAVPYAIR
jgi:phage terminase large subunit-like protein